MSEREIEWFNRFFPTGRSVAVLVKPERFKPTLFAFVVRNDDGSLQHNAPEDAIILPLAGRPKGAQPDQPEGKPVPSLAAPIITSPLPATPPSKKPDPPPPAAEPPPPTIIQAPPLKPTVEAAQAVTMQAPAVTEETLEMPRTAVIPPVTLGAPIPEPASVPMPVAEPARPVPAVTRPAPEPPPVAKPFEEPVAAAAPFRATVRIAQPPAETPTRIVPSRGVETRPVTSAAVDKPVTEKPAPEKVAAEAASASKPPTATDEIWRQRVEALPLRPAPPVLTGKSSTSVQEAPPVRRRAEVTQVRSHSRLAVFILVAALLGCLVGYWAYLRLPSAVIPLSVRQQAAGLIVSWPPDQTQHASQATIQVGGAQPVSLSPEERVAGQVAIAADGSDIRIELIARHWPRDSRGIVRFIRPAK